MAFDALQLKSVFELCKPDKEGFILTEYLADKLAEQFSDQDLAAVQDALDPDRVGRISFAQFCQAVTALQGKESLKKSELSADFDDNDSSDPENTYNEYDIPEDEISEMENLEIPTSSPHLSPVKQHDLTDPFRRKTSIRRSHRRVHSWSMKAADYQPAENTCDDTSSIASEYEDLSEKLDKIQGHVSRLEEDRTLQTRYELLKQENHQLNHRVHELEERVQDMAERSEEMRKASQVKIQDLHREHELQLQVLRSKIEVLGSDKERLKSELAATKKSAKESRESLNNLQNQSEILTKQIMETNEEYRRLSKRFASQHDAHQFERVKLREETEEIRKQLRSALEENKKLKIDLNDAEFDPSSARIKAQMDHLKAENGELKRNNEELTDQLAQHLTEARLLVCSGEETSIAEELNNATRDEVMEALVKQEQVNDQLRSYLERITLNILERNPEILEIK